MAWAAVAAVAGPVIGGLLSSDSASSAADTQAAATDRGVAETKRQYDTSRADLAPYRQAGTAALSRLQLLLGMGDSSGLDYDKMARDQYEKDLIAQRGYGIGPSEEGRSDIVANINAYKSQLQEMHKNDPTNPDSGSLLSKFTPKQFTAADLDADPVYQSGLKFGLDEGTKAIERRSVARGGLDSGATLKELTRFADDYGSTKAADSYGRFTTNQNNLFAQDSQNKDRAFGYLTGVSGMGSGATTAGVQAGNTSASNLANLYSGQGNAAAAARIAGGNAVSSGFTGASNAYGQYNMLQKLTGGGQRELGPQGDL